MMIKMLGRCSRLSLLGLALSALTAGCGEPNAKEGGDRTEIADPKYAEGTPEQYKQAFQDASKQSATGKGKMAPAKAKATVPEPEKKPVPEPEKKP